MVAAAGAVAPSRLATLLVAGFSALSPFLAPAATAAPTLTSTPSSVAQVGVAYSQANKASGGTSPYTYSISGGTLPPGLSLSSSTGLVSGTPTRADSFSYTVRVTDATKATASKTVSGTIAVAAVSQGIYASDVVYNISASDLDSYKYATVQCQGTNSYFWDWGGQYGYFRSPLPLSIVGTGSSGSFLAFSTVASPGESSKSAFHWDVHSTDPDTAGTGSKRCEFSLGWKEYSYPGKVFSRQVGLPANKNYWWGVAVRTEDWAATASVNDWQIVWQFHDGYGGGLPPFLDLAVKGSQWVLQGTYDMSTTPKDSTLKKLVLWSSTMPANTWARFIVKTRKDLVTPANSFVQVWLNGQQIVNYRGPIGYNVPQMDYAKVGVYKWISSANVWSSNVPARRTWTKGPVMVNDRSGYTWQAINGLLD
jgi:hypothetical protein